MASPTIIQSNGGAILERQLRSEIEEIGVILKTRKHSNLLKYDGETATITVRLLQTAFLGPPLLGAPDFQRVVPIFRFDVLAFEPGRPCWTKNTIHVE